MIEQNVTSSYTEIYVGGGNSITESYPTNFHTFVTRRILAQGDDISNYREVTAKERTTIEASDAAWERPPQVFIDRWNVACRIMNTVYGKYNEQTGFFELNGLTDITYKEAVVIEYADFPRYASGTDRYYTASSNMYQFSNIRTNIPPRKRISSWNESFFGMGIQVVNLGPLPQPDVFPYACGSLHTIMGVIENNSGHYIGGGCESLVEMHMKMTVAKNFNIVGSPKLSYDTIAYFVKNSVTGASIALHKNVYAKLTGDTTNAAAAELSEEELKQWTDLADLAAERGIGLLTA